MDLIGQAVSENKNFEIVNDDRRTPEHGHPISSSFEPWAQVSKKKALQIVCPQLLVDLVDPAGLLALCRPIAASKMYLVDSE